METYHRKSVCRHQRFERRKKRTFCHKGSGSLYCSCRNHWNRKYCRSSDCFDGRRAWGNFLDVGFGSYWNGDCLWGNLAGVKTSLPQFTGSLGMRTCGVPKQRASYACYGICLWNFMPVGLPGDGEYGSVQRHCSDDSVFYRNFSCFQRCDSDDVDLLCGSRRNFQDCPCDRAADSLGCRDLYRLLVDGSFAVLPPDSRGVSGDFSVRPFSSGSGWRSRGIWN